MKALKSISLVIPVLNGSKYITNQWQSFLDYGLLEFISEIIYVNDGSTDNTIELLNALKSTSPKPLKIINNEESTGRFLARLVGAKEASSSHILFLDSRLTIDRDFARAFAALKDESDCLMGHVDIDTKRNVFCLYWDRTHRFIFKRHFQRTKERVVLTKENAGEFLKGTTVFFTNRIVFIDVCTRYEKNPLLNDDTIVIEEIVALTPLVLDPSWRIKWLPRETLSAFLGRMWERGPSFVEYHFFAKRGFFFWLVILGLAMLACWLILLVTIPDIGILVALLALGLLALTTAFFSKSASEFFLMAPLHVSVTLTFGAAILWGIVVNFRRMR